MHWPTGASGRRVAAGTFFFCGPTDQPHCTEFNDETCYVERDGPHKRHITEAQGGNPGIPCERSV